MSSERGIFNYAAGAPWDWLTHLGEPVWGLEQYRDLSPEERNRRAFREMRAMIGQPTLEAWRNLYTQFGDDLGEESAIMGVFYYYYRKPGSTDHVQREARVIFPFKVATNPDLLSRDWIDRQREILAQEWDLSPVSFGVSGNIYTSIELEDILCHSERVGELGEHWYSGGENRIFLQRTKRIAFMVFGDIDEKTSDEQLMGVSKQLGTPFLVADTKRGHHLVFPLFFRTNLFGDEQLVIEISNKLGVVVGISDYERYLFRSMGNREYVLRVTPGLGREETPRISALVWGNTVVRTPAPAT